MLSRIAAFIAAIQTSYSEICVFWLLDPLICFVFCCSVIFVISQGLQEEASCPVKLTVFSGGNQLQFLLTDKPTASWNKVHSVSSYMTTNALLLVLWEWAISRSCLYHQEYWLSAQCFFFFFPITAVKGQRATE